MALFNQPPQSLCILRLSAIGDVCHALAAVQQIQRHYPACKITWIIGKTERALLQNVQHIEFICYDKKSGWRGVLALWKQLCNRRFDALLNMQTALRASLLSIGIRAKYKIGFGQQRAREMQWLFTNQRVQDPVNPHVLDGFLAFAQAIGAPTQAASWDLPVSQQDRAAVQNYLDPTRKNLLIAPCSSKAEKDWLPEHYAQVANVAHQHGVNVILAGSPAPKEVAMIGEIEKLCDFRPHNIAGKTSLTQLTALIGMVDLVLAPDSGPAHIATTQSTPVVGLYAYHNPLRTGPYRNLANVVSVYEQNAQQEFGKPSAQLPWATKLKGKNLMAQISVDEVLAQIQPFLW